MAKEKKRKKENTAAKGQLPKSENGTADGHYRKMEKKARFWNRIDPANRFRHWYMGTISFTRSFFRVVAAWQTVVILITILVILYILAAFYTGRGEFVIKLDRPMANEGFLLSETGDFSECFITLRNEAVEDVTNISIFDLPKNIMNVDGKHNGRDYVAYTFYLKNETLEAKDYQYELNVISTSNHVDTASWVMVFKNGKQQIYAQENANGYPECIYNRWEFPFLEYAENLEYLQSVVRDETEAHITEEMIQYHEFTDIEGLYQLQSVPWESEDLICSGVRQDMQVGEVDKYTVVIWLEGDDPDCQNDIIGGHLEVAMKFYY